MIDVPINAHPSCCKETESPPLHTMDGDLYDEFGNYIGPDLESDESEEEEQHYAGGRDEVCLSSHEVHDLCVFPVGRCRGYGRE